MEFRARRWRWAMLALLACTSAIPFAAPIFPSQDGPVHLYYVDVLRGVLAQSAPYDGHFALKSYLTPYALEYYALLALETVFSAPMSEKLLLAGYIFAFGLGFLYLVESVAEQGTPWILAGLPFCLHMLVYMGFLNYCCAVAILLFECGLWLRFSGSLTPRRVLLLFGGLCLLLIAHPVAVMAFLLFLGIHFVCAPRAGRDRLFLTAVMAAISLLWIGRFVDRSGAIAPSHVATWGWFNAMATELQLYPIAPFTGILFRAGPTLLIALVCCAAIAGLRRGAPPDAISLLATSAICFLLFCLAPERISGGYYFAERFPILWVLFLLAGTSALRLPRGWNEPIGVTSAAVAAIALVLQWHNVSEIGLRMATAGAVPQAVEGSVGLMIGRHGEMPDGLAFNPYLWSGVHYFRESRAILANEPWMEMPILMLRPVHPDRWSYHDPDFARQELETDIAIGLPASCPDFIVQAGPVELDVERLLRRSGWSQTGGTSGSLRLYRRP
jgi:hypothetical protein